jgi:FMN phosphatase YigB (HAD superfamily)
VQRSRLRVSGLRDRFHAVVTSEGCGYAKPDPRIVLFALRRIGARPEDAVFVGDNPTTDGDAAHGAGVRFVWLDRSVHDAPRRRPFRRVTSLGGLAQLIAEL